MHDEVAAWPCPVHEVFPSVEQHERRTRWVVGITATMMVAELIVGTLTRSLALTADGWHMATHAGALGVSALAYWFARTRAQVESLDDARVVDLHLWELAPGRLGCLVSVLASEPRSVAAYREAILAAARVEHLTVEGGRCPHHQAA